MFVIVKIFLYTSLLRLVATYKSQFSAFLGFFALAVRRCFRSVKGFGQGFAFAFSLCVFACSGFRALSFFCPIGLRPS